MREQDLFNTYNAKRYEDTLKLGRQILEREPENFFVLGVMSEAGLENALAGKAKSNTETIDYLKRAIKLLDGNNVTKPSPFESMEFARGFLNAVSSTQTENQRGATYAKILSHYWTTNRGSLTGIRTNRTQSSRPKRER